MVKISTKQLFNKAVTQGTGSDKIHLDISEVFALLHVAFDDLHWQAAKFKLPDLENQLPSEDYFNIQLLGFKVIIFLH